VPGWIHFETISAVLWKTEEKSTENQVFGMISGKSPAPVFPARDE
jgi:hypothetical protein